jgi:hypothetical protein
MQIMEADFRYNMEYAAAVEYLDNGFDLRRLFQIVLGRHANESFKKVSQHRVAQETQMSHLGYGTHLHVRQALVDMAGNMERHDFIVLAQKDQRGLSNRFGVKGVARCFQPIVIFHAPHRLACHWQPAQHLSKHEGQTIAQATSIECPFVGYRFVRVFRITAQQSHRHDALGETRRRGAGQTAGSATRMTRHGKRRQSQMIRQLLDIRDKRVVRVTVVVQWRIRAKVTRAIDAYQNILSGRIRHEKGIARQEHGVKAKDMGQFVSSR